MPTPRRPHWDSLVVCASASKALDGAVRLAALYRWYRGDRAIYVFQSAPPDGAPIADPGVVDWTEFPTAEAIRAVSRERSRGCQGREILE